MKYQNNTLGNTNNYNQINTQNIYDRNQTNMANLNTLVQNTKDDIPKNEYRNTYNNRPGGNFNNNALNNPILYFLLIF